MTLYTLRNICRLWERLSEGARLAVEGMSTGDPASMYTVDVLCEARGFLIGLDVEGTEFMFADIQSVLHPPGAGTPSQTDPCYHERQNRR